MRTICLISLLSMSIVVIQSLKDDDYDEAANTDPTLPECTEVWIFLMNELNTVLFMY